MAAEVWGRLEADGAELAYRKVEGPGPTVVWLGGFRSDMAGTKAQALADRAMKEGRAYLRFDYFGHGESGGAFEAGTITRWRADALAAIDRLTEGPLVLVGSSMGGWLACLAAMARPERLQGLVLVAPAADFTERLMRPEMDAAAQAEMKKTGIWLRPSDYGDPYPITRALLEDGARWGILPGPIRLGAPVRILQGGADPDVPWRHALALSEAIEDDDLVFTLVRDGDHRLSRAGDLARLAAAVAEVGG
ncbi:alpha/beta fold hydrolase [Phenylobacterium montanum]|uniref:Palmitoyl-protein thioesterase ABHD10, mitochondrial n=1 Tax=Phenylobacterium montanum TaxID=2823693 RepID=A0A975FZ22_9CAUL|nr:alpha/beta fold hydrolase [Caulobacter sp. S6]QUD87488.1 alpha/beta hydrolase [Caulobacter sp. S6]